MLSDLPEADALTGARIGTRNPSSWPESQSFLDHTALSLLSPSLDYRRAEARRLSVSCFRPQLVG